MNSYSQNGEDKIIFDYFKGHIGTVLEIGANDGKTLSNSLALIESGWYGVLFEPGNVYDELHRLHKDNDRVHTHRLGIGLKEGIIKFWQSGAHVKGGSDTGLVSTTDLRERLKWEKRGVHFMAIEIELVPFSWVAEKYPVFDFISIDVEGMDWEVLQQIDLTKVGCKCLCIEWNSVVDFAKVYTNYCAAFGLKEIHRNAENIIFAI